MMYDFEDEEPRHYPGVRFLAQQDAGGAGGESDSNDTKKDIMKDHWKWSETYMRKVGSPVTYFDNAPAGYSEHLNFEGSRQDQSDQSIARRQAEQQENLKEAKDLAKQSEHGKKTFPMNFESHEFNFPNAEPEKRPKAQYGMPGAEKSKVKRSIF